MSYSTPDYYQGPAAASHSPPRSNSKAQKYNGAYGRDGAPSSKFMTPIETAYAPSTPRRQNIAPAERAIPQSRLFHGAVDFPSPRRSPPLASGHPRSRSPAPDYPWSRSASPPMYQDARGQYHQYAEDAKLLPPRPVFVEPKTKRVDAYVGSLVHGKEMGDDGQLQEKSEPSIRNEADGADVWRRIGRESNENSESTWLSRNSAAGSKFKSAAWVVAVFVLVVIGGAVTYAVTHHSPPSAPSALGWANGAQDVPTFGMNSTATAANRSVSTTPKMSNSLSPRSLNRPRARNHKAISKLKN